MRKKPHQNNGGNLITNYMNKSKGEEKSSSKAQGHKKQQHTQIDFHESSMEAQQDSSKTQVLQSEMEQEWVEQRPQEICLQMIMIAPYDTTYYKGFKRKTKELRSNYNKDNTIKFIMDNAKYEGITNLKNLQRIEDEEFWNRTVPILLEYAEDDKKQKSIASNIRMLVPTKNEVLSLTKAQVFMALVNMFLCIFPKQTNRKTSHYNFVQLMTVTEKDSESTSSMKLQKLRCVVNYLKIMSKRKYKQLESRKIEYQRCVADIERAEYRNVEYRMKEVDVKVGFVQDSYEHDLIIDFANKNIGGGVLNRGAVQEQILFCVFPQLLFMVAVCYELKKNESFIIYGAERVNLYQGYSETFKFTGTFEQKSNQDTQFKSVIVAVDATDFRSAQFRQSHQYQIYHIERELQKFLGGILGADYGADEKMKVCTGKWGCGAFGGDFYLKFIIQWIACSMANKDMIFTCQKDEKKQLEVLVNFLKRFDSLELLEIIQEYNYYEDSNKNLTFLEFIKKYCS